MRFVLPEARFGKRWRPEIDTAALGDGTPAEPEAVLGPGAELQLAARSLMVLRRIDDAER
jgi:hypothetical protein